jgi:hypothetical protein
MKSAQDLAGSTQSEKRLAEQRQTTLHLQIGIFVARAERIAYEADWQGEREVATLRFGEEAGAPARFDGMELELGNLAFASQHEATIGTARLVDAMAVGDSTVAIAT